MQSYASTVSESDITAERGPSVVDNRIDLMKRHFMDGERRAIRGFGSFEMHEYGGYQ